MSMYANFTIDFPNRCRLLLREFGEQASKSDQEVTLLISVLTAGFVIPYERLRGDDDTHIASDRLPKGKAALSRIERLPFETWSEDKSWRMAKRVPDTSVRTEQPDAWLQNYRPGTLTKNVQTQEVFALLRNALSHGAILVLPAPPSSSNPGSIEKVIFCSKVHEDMIEEYIVNGNTNCIESRKKSVYTHSVKVLVATPKALRKMFEKWVTFLQNEVLLSFDLQGWVADEEVAGVTIL